MKNFKKAAAGILAITMAFASTSCSEKDKDNSSSMPEKKLEAEQQDIIERLCGEITEPRELENTEIKWFSFWDINPTASEDKDIGVDLALFQTKYKGTVKYIPTVSWDTYFDDLAETVIAGDPPDFIGADDMNIFPKCALRNMIEPIDDYFNFDDPLWSDMKEACDKFVYDGKHWAAITRIDPSCIFIYNKNTITANGLDDPAELWKKGEWNWDTFSKMCTDFSDPDKEICALDGWYYEDALTASSGKPLISLENGQIVNNIGSAELAKAQNMMFELQKNNVVFRKDLHSWQVRGNVFGTGIASGETLFYPIGLWAIEDAPSVTKPYGDLSKGEVMFVPVPCAADSPAQYIPSRVHGFCICLGAKNPEGVAAFLDCTRYAELDEEAHQITIDQFKKDYGWTDEMLEMRDEIYQMAAEHPVFEFAEGVSTDVTNLTDNIVKTTMHPDPDARQTWTEVVSANTTALDYMLDEAQQKLAK